MSERSEDRAPILHLTTAQWDAVRAALEPVTLKPATLVALVDVIGTPAATGRFTTAAFHSIERVRARVHSAQAKVAALPASAARASATAALADLEESYALLAQIGRNTNPTRAARLKAQVAKVNAKLKVSAAKISPAVKVRAKP